MSQPPKKHRPVAVALTVLGLLAVTAIGTMLLWHGRCAQRVILTVPSPDGLWQVEQRLTDCGQTMRIASEVLLAPAGKKTGTGDAVVLLPGEAALPLAWEGSSTLAVTLPPQAELVRYEKSWRGVSVVLRGGPIAPAHKFGPKR